MSPDGESEESESSHLSSQRLVQVDLEDPEKLRFQEEFNNLMLKDIEVANIIENRKGMPSHHHI